MSRLKHLSAERLVNIVNKGQRKNVFMQRSCLATSSGSSRHGATLKDTGATLEGAEGMHAEAAETVTFSCVLHLHTRELDLSFGSGAVCWVRGGVGPCQVEVRCGAGRWERSHFSH